jgi:hypothetical protein
MPRVSCRRGSRLWPAPRACHEYAVITVARSTAVVAGYRQEIGVGHSGCQSSTKGGFAAKAAEDSRAKHSGFRLGPDIRAHLGAMCYHRNYASRRYGLRFEYGIFRKSVGNE